MNAGLENLEQKAHVKTKTDNVKKAIAQSWSGLQGNSSNSASLLGGASAATDAAAAKVVFDLCLGPVHVYRRVVSYLC